jgi:hypothetical protein
MTRLPPYLKRHADRLRTDPSASVWVAIGAGAWQWARERERLVAIVCPPGEDPAALDWSPCRGHDPVLLMPAGAVEGDQIKALIGALFRDGVERVLTPGKNEGLLYYREVVHG